MESNGTFHLFKTYFLVQITATEYYLRVLCLFIQYLYFFVFLADF